VGAQGQVGIFHEVDRETFGQLFVDPAAEKYLFEFLTLYFGVVGQRLALDPDLVLVELLLRAHGQVLTGAHREGARDESGQSGQSHDVVPGVGAGEAQNERHVGNQSVEEAKQRRSKTSVADLTVVRLAVDCTHAGSLGGPDRGVGTHGLRD